MKGLRKGLGPNTDPLLVLCNHREQQTAHSKQRTQY